MKRWEGLTYQEWIGVFDASDWRNELEDALYEIASSGRTAREDRIEALNLIGIAMYRGILEYDPAYPSLMRDVMRDELLREGKKKSARRARKMRRWLDAAKAMLAATVPWFEHKALAEKIATATAEAAKKSDVPTNN